MFEMVYGVILFLSDQITQFCLMVWGLSRISVIMFSFLLIGVLGMISSLKFFHNVLVKIALVIAFTYLLTQSVYNFSFLDVFVKSVGTEMDKRLFFLGFYKYYNLFHGHLLRFDYDFEDIKEKKKDGAIFDMFAFILVLFLYNCLKQRQRQLRTNYKHSFQDLQDLGQVGELTVKQKFYIMFRQLITKESFKLTTLLLMVISISKVDLIHASYLFFFVLIMYFYSDKTIKIFFKILVYYNALLITTLYVIHLFNLPLSPSTKDLLGIAQTDNKLLLMYKEHFFLLLICSVSLRVNGDSVGDGVKSGFEEKVARLKQMVFKMIFVHSD